MKYMYIRSTLEDSVDRRKKYTGVCTHIGCSAYINVHTQT